MAIVSLIRTYRFSAAHRYYREEWTEEENRRVFGKCANPHGHGHNYRLEVEVTGPVDEETGFLIGLDHLDHHVSGVLEGLDHKHLNEGTPWFRDKIPSTENVARLLWNQIRKDLNVKLARIRLFEDDDLSVEIRPGQCEGECGHGHG